MACGGVVLLRAQWAQVSAPPCPRWCHLPTPGGGVGRLAGDETQTWSVRTGERRWAPKGASDTRAVWVDLEGPTLSETGQARGPDTTCAPRRSCPRTQTARQGAAGGAQWGLLFNGDHFDLGRRKVLEATAVMAAEHCECA